MASSEQSGQRVARRAYEKDPDAVVHVPQADRARRPAGVGEPRTWALAALATLACTGPAAIHKGERHTPLEDGDVQLARSTELRWSVPSSVPAAAETERSPSAVPEDPKSLASNPLPGSEGERDSGAVGPLRDRDAVAASHPTPASSRRGPPCFDHRVQAPSMRVTDVRVSGSFTRAAVERIVASRAFGRFRLCYENGLRFHPSLQGHVTVKFVVDATGSVTSFADDGSDLPESGVVTCVVRSFGSLTFPSTESGLTEVVYSVAFSPAPPAPCDRKSVPTSPNGRGRL